MKNIIRSLLSSFNKKPKQSFKSEKAPVFDRNDDYPPQIKAKLREKLKQEFQPVRDATTAVDFGRKAVRSYILNHGLDFDDFESDYSDDVANVPTEKLESWLRKGISSEYTKRSNLSSKCRSVFYAQKHIELTLFQSNTPKSHAGFKRLNTSLADEEYLPNLVKQNYFYSEHLVQKFEDKSEQDKVSALFKTLAARKFATSKYKENLSNYEKATTASDKHFLINGIVTYLARKVKFKPIVESELIEWCERDVLLYQDFLRFDAELHFSSVLPFEEILDDPDKPKKLAAMMRFSDVKKLEGYFVPRLPSFDTLVKIYETKKDEDKLNWLKELSLIIGYLYHDEKVLPDHKVESSNVIDLKKITKMMSAKKSGKKGKLAFLDSKGNECSTEDAFVDGIRKEGWNVLRAEVSFWQAMFCLLYYEEIFEGPVRPVLPNDIPEDMFSGKQFFTVRRPAIEKKNEILRRGDISRELLFRIKKYKNVKTRLLDFGPALSFRNVLSDENVHSFLDAAGAEKIASVVYRIAQNPSEHRAGVTDFVIWRDNEVKFVEVKKEKEAVRESQLNWLRWYESMCFDVVIYRL